MSTLDDILAERERLRETVSAVREYAMGYDDHIRKELLEILEGEPWLSM